MAGGGREGLGVSGGQERQNAVRGWMTQDKAEMSRPCFFGVVEVRTRRATCGCGGCCGARKNFGPTPRRPSGRLDRFEPHVPNVSPTNKS